ncbi:flagellar basal body rod protein FlgC [Roseinatronobacter bogoriensis]|uniref:Flagellar basal body rod protein FlgC n=1 Tax=Roseinatronobacter bogoriensis subsp. barguzinensis TaxID=441209 RepID=A0A2K8K977_9RHOB|nr:MULTISPECIES: flagellar basal body rod protein FlgC [Rhodobaca]ATX66004.1 flagellar basal body rod protein FlgC [Rhodobaca barguzinensis]MBB4207999.1 flagellar basal-body rod protein FlgC [Rhodobaca bogoriensis DSM 18756]TDW38638.1 flagellar basal-body rod protein FlgC [Rhodobaca barguzinensis]TDY69323.1 flagellar basal-body rod protein FlgC [Rhodobaca bogoriensis DSM 18756]
MSDLFSSFSIAASGMESQARRLRHVSENISNADTPGYRRKTVNFHAETDRATGVSRVQVGPVQLDPRELPRIYDPGHALADENGFYNGSTVDLMIEVADAREAGRSYEANLRVFDQTRQMAQGLLDLLRR